MRAAAANPVTLNVCYAFPNGLLQHQEHACCDTSQQPTHAFAGAACCQALSAGLPVLPPALRHRHVLRGAHVVLLLVPSRLSHALLPRTAPTRHL